MKFNFEHSINTYRGYITTGSTSNTLTTAYNIQINNITLLLSGGEGVSATCTINGISDTQPVTSTEPQRIKFNISTSVSATSNISITLKRASGSVTIYYYGESRVTAYSLFQYGIYSAASSTTILTMSMEIDVDNSELWRRNDDINEGYPYVFKESFVKPFGYWKVDETGEMNEGYPYLWWEEGKPPIPISSNWYLKTINGLIKVIPYYKSPDKLTLISQTFIKK